MPATGTIFFKLQQSSGDWKLMFRATASFYFYLDHVVSPVAMNIGDVIQAGTLVGTTNAGSTLDLGAFDETVTHDGFVTPSRYAIQTLHYVSPWKYFTPALQAQLQPQMYRASGWADKDGKIDFGVPGRLSGDWYQQGLPATSDSSAGPAGWPRTISFAYDYYDPTRVRISIGGTIDAPGVWGIDSTAPLPVNVSVASGIVAYRLLRIFDAPTQYGLMLVQMTDASTIKVEVFPGSTASTGQFDSKAFTFVR
jgi:hypothetical protein